MGADIYTVGVGRRQVYFVCFHDALELPWTWDILDDTPAHHAVYSAFADAGS